MGNMGKNSMKSKETGTREIKLRMNTFNLKLPKRMFFSYCESVTKILVLSFKCFIMCIASPLNESLHVVSVRLFRSSRVKEYSWHSCFNCLIVFLIYFKHIKSLQEHSCLLVWLDIKAFPGEYL